MIGNGYGSEFHLLRWMGRQCPRTPEEWNPAINAQWEELGTSSGPLLDRIHKLFLPVSESSLQEFRPKTAMTNLRAIQ